MQHAGRKILPMHRDEGCRSEWQINSFFPLIPLNSILILSLRFALHISVRSQVSADEILMKSIAVRENFTYYRIVSYVVYVLSDSRVCCLSGSYNVA